MPIRLKKSSSTDNPMLELLFYKGQYQLATHDALYSDGDRYKPINVACKYLGDEVKSLNDVLVLGTGLASTVSVIHKHGGNPNITLVEKDKQVLDWAKELMPDSVSEKVSFVHADAEQFMKNNTRQYDMIFTDIFISREVPAFVTTKEFIASCHKSIRPNGYWVLNYMVQNSADWENVNQIIRDIFPRSIYLEEGINRIIVATA